MNRLASYNSGILHGAWIDAATDPWEIWDGVNAMLARSPVAGAEEYAIHDYEGFGAVRIEEFTGFEQVAEIAAFLAEHGEIGGELLNYYGNDLAEAREAMTEHYLGCHPSLADYMQELTEEATAIPHALRYYIDYQAMARDAEMSGALFTVETGHERVHIFAAR